MRAAKGAGPGQGGQGEHLRGVFLTQSQDLESRCLGRCQGCQPHLVDGCGTDQSQAWGCGRGNVLQKPNLAPRRHQIQKGGLTVGILAGQGGKGAVISRETKRPTVAFGQMGLSGGQG